MAPSAKWRTGIWVTRGNSDEPELFIRRKLQQELRKGVLEH